MRYLMFKNNNQIGTIELNFFVREYSLRMFECYLLRRLFQRIKRCHKQKLPTRSNVLYLLNRATILNVRSPRVCVSYVPKSPLFRVHVSLLIFITKCDIRKIYWMLLNRLTENLYVCRKKF